MKAPSAVKRRKKFGNLNAIKNASAIGPAPRIDAINMSRAKPVIRLIIVNPLTVATARKRDNGENVAALAASCKLFATEMVGRVADRAVQIHGGAGYMEEYAVTRFYRDVRLFRIYEGTSEIQRGIIARRMISNVER